MIKAQDGTWVAVRATVGPRLQAIYLRDLLRELVVRDMKLRYERSFLGVLWAVANPLAQLLVFVIVFKHVIHLEIPNYPLFVFIGVLAWNWTRQALLRSSNAITGNRDLIRQPGFPLGLLPVVSLATPLIDLVIALPVLLLFLMFGGGEFTMAILFLPVVIALQFLLLQGLGYLVAATQVAFRDTSHLLGVILMLGFYLTPIFYDIQDVPPSFRTLYVFNPIVHIITAYRSIILHGQPPELGSLLVLALLGTILCWTGWRVFERASHRFAEAL